MWFGLIHFVILLFSNWSDHPTPEKLVIFVRFYVCFYGVFMVFLYLVLNLAVFSFPTLGLVFCFRLVEHPTFEKLAISVRFSCVFVFSLSVLPHVANTGYFIFIKWEIKEETSICPSRGKKTLVPPMSVHIIK